MNPADVLTRGTVNGEHRIAAVSRRPFRQIEVQVLHILEAPHPRTEIMNGKRVARAIRSAAAHDVAAHTSAAEMDRVVVRRAILGGSAIDEIDVDGSYVDGVPVSVS